MGLLLQAVQPPHKATNKILEISPRDEVALKSSL
jgi:DNA-directed RNA polymerase subunit F